MSWVFSPLAWVWALPSAKYCVCGPWRLSPRISLYIFSSAPVKLKKNTHTGPSGPSYPGHASPQTTFSSVKWDIYTIVHCGTLWWVFLIGLRALWSPLGNSKSLFPVPVTKDSIYINPSHYKFAVANSSGGQVWWHLPVILTLGKLRNHHGF